MCSTEIYGVWNFKFHKPKILLHKPIRITHVYVWANSTVHSQEGSISLFLFLLWRQRISLVDKKTEFTSHWKHFTFLPDRHTTTFLLSLGNHQVFYFLAKLLRCRRESKIHKFILWNCFTNGHKSFSYNLLSQFVFFQMNLNGSEGKNRCHIKACNN